jgi:pimeloyl-ACP methyl ester carboxylesterase
MYSFTKVPNSVQGYGLTLHSGRKLVNHTNGPENGTRVIYVHGHPDSGLAVTGPLEERTAKELNVQWIGPDQPGIGLSTA